MSDLVLETKDLTKRYGAFVAVDHLNLAVHEGEVFGLLGPNGAGKTTTILMLLGLTEPTGGQVRVLGLDPSRQPLRVKAHVGYMPDQVGFYDELSARENLAYIAKLNAIARREIDRRIDEVLERVHLKDVADRRVGTFSRGMRQRLGLADVLIKRPKLIIMDEPTQGLDPELAHEFLDLIRKLKEEGITILLSSHLLHQVQVICDRVGLFSQGRMVLQGAVPELARKVLGGASARLARACRRRRSRTPIWGRDWVSGTPSRSACVLRSDRRRARAGWCCQGGARFRPHNGSRDRGRACG